MVQKIRSGIFGFCLMTVLAFSLNASAEGLTIAKGSATVEEVQKVREQVGEFISGLRGITGSMISLCEAKSGVPFYQLERSVVDASEFAYCLVFSTDQEATKTAMDVLFPGGTKFNNVFIPVELAPQIIYEPH